MKKKHSEKVRGVKALFKKINKNGSLSRAKENFLEIAGIPSYMQKNMTRISMYGNKNICIEQYDSIVDYFNHYIKIKCFELYVIVEGKDLNVSEISSDDLIITGEIDSISYKKMGGK